MPFNVLPIQLSMINQPLAFVAGAVIVGGLALAWVSAGAIADVIVGALAQLWAMVYRLFNDLPE